MVLSRAASRLISQPLACNVYISAGGLPWHAPILLDLLKNTQKHCSRLTNAQKATSNNHTCVVVHAFSDMVYNRSSFHLAGSENQIADVVSTLVKEARQKLSDGNKNHETATSENQNVNHPYVGLVDHIAVMPLTDKNEELENASEKSNNEQGLDFQPNTPSGRAARRIGASISGANVLYYGTADPDGTPLAEVRRKKTKFFQSGGLESTTGKSDSSHDDTPQNVQRDIATVGAPPQFVENFNIRLTKRCDKNRAQSLTRFVRERDGGLSGVEALTLPYSQGRYEVACNLLQPQIGSSEAIRKKVEEWAASIELPEELAIGTNLEYLVETSYRVGTTADQCLNTLAFVTESDNTSSLNEHNQMVVERLKDNLHEK